MRERALVLTALMCLCAAACIPGTAYPGTLESFANACDKFNEGRQIAVEGYLRLPDTLRSTSSVLLRLYPDLTFQGSPIGVLMRFGDRANEASPIVSAFHDEDLRVHLADSTLVPFGTRVRVSGRMRIPLGPSRVTCELDNPYVEKAK